MLEIILGGLFTLLGGVVGALIQAYLYNKSEREIKKDKEAEQLRKLQFELQAEFFDLLLAKEATMMLGVIDAGNAKKLDWISRFNSIITKISLYGNEDFILVIKDKDFSRLTDPYRAIEFDKNIIYEAINELRMNFLDNRIEPIIYDKLETLRIK